MCTCLCKTCRNISELRARELRECSSLMEQVAVYAASAVYRLCDVWGRLSSPNKAWERQRGTQQCCICLDGGVGGGVSVWRWDPDQTNPPVTHQVPGSSVIPAEADSAKKTTWFLTLWFLCGIVVLFQVWKKQVFTLGGEYLGWITEQRVSSLEWGRLIPYLKKKPESHPLLWA